MRRLSLLLVPLLLAACGGGSTRPDDFLVDSLDSPRFYVGTAFFTRTSEVGVINDVVVIGGTNVRFGTTDTGAPPVGYTMVSGTMTVSHDGDVPVPGLGLCTISGQTSFPLGPGDGSVILFPGGRYSGTIRKEVVFISFVACPRIARYALSDSARIDLEIDGTLLDGRMQGTMAPVTIAQSRFQGAWNFTPVLTN